MQVRSTDVVVVGGGAAGCTAALNLSHRGIDAVADAPAERGGPLRPRGRDPHQGRRAFL